MKQKQRKLIVTTFLILGASQIANAQKELTCIGPLPERHCFNHPMRLVLTYTYNNIVPMFHDDVLDVDLCGWPPVTVLSEDFAIVTSSELNPPNSEQHLNLFRQSYEPRADGEMLYKKYGEVVLKGDANFKYSSGVYTANDGTVTSLTCTERELNRE